ncbi:MAG TPA: uracil-DNA glycosylase [Gammaproteobacteria bacterium]|jgi:uracil-DNA glycosylase family 4|nr:uracil-DNA glycosylase [Gammaproteobacteria bacterium]
MKADTVFDIHCKLCPRLAGFLKDVRKEHPDYYALPVPPFGDPRARLIVVGLAPGMHGANRTGRPFTGDFAGILLYATLHKFGFANQAEGTSPDDGLKLKDCRITNAVKCLPPANKPQPDEIARCNRYISTELHATREGTVLLALGLIAHNAVLKSFGLKLSQYKFGHGAEHAMPGGRVLLDSYHCSRYNTQTRRLTTAMFEKVVKRARALLP